MCILGLLEEKCNVKKLAVIEEHNKPKEEKKQQESVKKEEVNSEKQELNEERDFKKTFLDLAAVLAFFALAFAQQIVALPFRFSSSKKYLSKLLEHTAGYMMYFYCVVISGVLDDTCYGADLKTFKTYDDFTATLSKVYFKIEKKLLFYSSKKCYGIDSKHFFGTIKQMFFAFSFYFPFDFLSMYVYREEGAISKQV